MASPIGAHLMDRFLTHIGKGRLGKRLVLLLEITPGKKCCKKCLPCLKLIDIVISHIKNGFDACTNLLSGKVVCLKGR